MDEPKRKKSRDRFERETGVSKEERLENIRNMNKQVRSILDDPYEGQEYSDEALANAQMATIEARLNSEMQSDRVKAKEERDRDMARKRAIMEKYKQLNSDKYGW
jgi:hypothetical protein